MENERGSITLRFGFSIGATGEVSLTIGSETDSQAPSTPTEFPPTILFTGFKAADRVRLEKLAVEYNLMLRKSVSHGLTMLVTGYNAGPSKIAAAKQEGAMVLNESQFIQLMNTGELTTQE